MWNIHDAPSLAVPLLVDEKQQRLGRELGEIEPNHPHYHDSSRSKTSFFKTCFNGINSVAGVGILSIPYALASGGWLSLILLFLIAAATFYSGLLIKRCMDVDSEIRSYPDIGECAFGKKGRLIVSIFMNIELYLVATGFLILEGDNLVNLFPNMAIELGGLTVCGKKCFIVIIALIILPTVWLDNLSLFSYVSASGVLASVITLGSIFWTGAFDGVGFHQKGTLVNWKGIPTSISLYAFCYCAHPLFPTLYTSMKKKHQFHYVLVVCFFLCTLIYASTAIFGYMMFGSEVQSQITLSLPISKLSSKLAIYTTLVNPIAKYALMVTPIVNAIKMRFSTQYRTRPFSLLISTGLVISTVIIALVVPFFSYLMSLVGAFLSVAASVILPCLCYLKISGAYRRYSIEMIAILAIASMGVIVAAIGTYVSLVQIVGRYV